MTPAKKTQSLPKLKELNPTEISELSELLGPAPLLPGENEADYEALKMRIMAAVKPADAIEHLYVRDVTDLQWDLLRFRRLKSHLLSSSAPSGLAALMSARKYTPFNDARFASWLNNDPKAVKEIKALLTQWGLTEQDIHAQTMVKKSTNSSASKKWHHPSKLAEMQHFVNWSVTARLWQDGSGMSLPSRI